MSSDDVIPAYLGWNNAERDKVGLRLCATDHEPATCEMLDLAAHVIAMHNHGADEATVNDGPLDVLTLWHDWEHDLRWPIADHEHDEFSARRRSVPCVAPEQGPRVPHPVR